MKNPSFGSVLPEGFVYLKDVCPRIEIHMMYFYSENFTGENVPGYQSNKAITTKEAADALCVVQKSLENDGYGLKIYDAYRPQKAIESFRVWAESPEDFKTKEKFYPNIIKRDLLNGYISTKSAHNRGSTVDLTIIDLRTKQEIEMGTIVDFLDEKAHTKNVSISENAQRNRQKLVEEMEKVGFKNYSMEWWHYQLKNEPFTPDNIAQPFDFDIK